MNWRIGTLFRASQFLSEELPIRLAHRVQELGELPDGLNEMTSIKRVQDWYAQSFEVSQYDLNKPNDGNGTNGSKGIDHSSTAKPFARRSRSLAAA